jgi:hypothetical protein
VSRAFTGVALRCAAQAFEKLRQKVCLKEKILLQTVEFNLCLELPFSHITRLCSEVSRNGATAACSRAVCVLVASRMDCLSAL